MPIRETQKLPGLKAYPVNKRELRQVEVGWEWLYGKLSKGQYRIIKNNLDEIKKTCLIVDIETSAHYSNGQEINQQILGIEIKTSSIRGVKKIKCSIDNITLNIIEIKEENGGQEEKRKCEINLSGLKAGTHKIKVSAFDDIDNHKSQEVWIKTLISFDKKIIWITPQSNQIIRQTNFPFNVSILVPVLKIQKIKFFNQQEDNKINLLGTIFTPESAGLINFSWPMADVGAHKIWAEIVDINGETLITDKIQIEIK